MAKVIMTSQQLVDRLKVLASRKTYYRNKYPDNLCYVHTDGRTSADCVNLLKAIFNGYDVYNQKAGYYQKSLTNTGDCTENGLLKQCSDISSDFKILKDAEPRILYMSGHVGCFIGLCEVNGKTYNVIECTAAWSGGILYSYVNEKGERYNYKDGTRKGRWTKHGKATAWVNYSSAPSVPEQPKTIYYVKRGDTLSAIAKANGLSLAKLVSYNPQIRDINKINVGDKIYLTSQTKEEYYTVQRGDTLGAIARKFNIALNELLGLNPDIKNPNLIHVGDKIRIK